MATAAPTIKEQNHQYGVDALGFEINTAVFIGVTTLALALRLYVRAFMLKSIATDDVLLIIAYAFFLVFTGAILAVGDKMRTQGLLVPVLYNIRGIITGESAYILCMVFVKFALAAFFLRIVYKSWHRWLIYISIGIYAVYALVPFCINIFQCGNPKPINFLAHTHCLGWNWVGPLNYVAAATNAVADWTMTLIPILVIMHLQVSKKNKIAAMVLVALGSAASIISVVRVPLIHKLKYTPDLSYFGGIVTLAYISTVEAGIAIIAMSISAYRPLWAGVSPYSSSRKYASNNAAPSNTRSGVRATGNKSGRHNPDRAGETAMAEAGDALLVTGTLGGAKEGLIIEKRDEITIQSEQI